MKDSDTEQPASSSTVSPPSASSSSPSHEFSFAISLHHPPSSLSSTVPGGTKSKSPPSNTAVDLSPADDIFFHGHLLPLHLLSHFPAVSPRTSAHSLDSFTRLPIREGLGEHKTSSRTTINYGYSSRNNHAYGESNDQNISWAPNKPAKFSWISRWRKEGLEFRGHQREEINIKEMKHKYWKQIFDVGDVIKRYARMVRPLLSFRSRRRSAAEKIELRRQQQAYSSSFSGSFIMSPTRKREGMRSGRRGEFFSAPASIWTSPANSGLLVADDHGHRTCATDHSTMEELHSAIQAAIAHCKNSSVAQAN